METSPLGLNVARAYLKNYGQFLVNVRSAPKPPAVITACIDSNNDIPLLKQMARDLPHTKIVGRVVVKDTDGKFHLKPEAVGDNREWIASTEDFLNTWRALGRDGMSLYCLNEPGTYYDASKPDEVERINRLVKWTCNVLTDAATENTSLTVLNMGTGHPPLDNDQWDMRLDPILRRLSLYRDIHFLGLHEYLPEQDRIGRFLAMIRRCQTLGIEPPRVIFTEGGYDSDKGDRNGYKDRKVPGEIYFDVLTGLIERVYRPYIDAGIILGYDVFACGDSGGWKQYDVEDDRGFWSGWARWSYKPKPAPVVVQVPEPVEEPKPAPAPEVPVNVQRGLHYAAIASLHRKLAEHYERLAKLELGEEVPT